MTVVDYEAKFTELSHFVPAFITDEKEKCRLFQDGLCLEIKPKTKMHDHSSFAELVVGAIRVEEIEKEFYSHRDERDKRSVHSFSMGTGENPPSKKVNVFGQPNQSFRALVEFDVDSFAFTSLEQKSTE